MNWKNHIKKNYNLCKNLTLLKDSDFDVGLMFTKDVNFHKLCCPGSFQEGNDNSEETKAISDKETSEEDASTKCDSTKKDETNKKNYPNRSFPLLPKSMCSIDSTEFSKTFLEKRYGDFLAQMEAEGKCPQPASGATNSSFPSTTDNTKGNNNSTSSSIAEISDKENDYEPFSKITSQKKNKEKRRSAERF